MREGKWHDVEIRDAFMYVAQNKIKTVERNGDRVEIYFKNGVKFLLDYGCLYITKNGKHILFNNL